MDESSPATSNESSAPKRPRTRRAKAAPPPTELVQLTEEATRPAPDTNSIPAEEKEPKSPAKARSRGRPRKPKSEESIGTDSLPEPLSQDLFSAPTPEPSAADQPEAASFVFSASPDDAPPTETRPIFSPTSISRGAEPVNDDLPPTSAAGADPHPETQPTPPDSDASPQAAEGNANPSLGASADPANSARREEKKSWWERKKEKKRQKWLERQQGGPGAKPVYPNAEPRERPPQQPAPPPLPRLAPSLPNDERLSDPSALDQIAEQLAQDPNPIDLHALHSESIVELAERLRRLGESVLGQPPRRPLLEQFFSWAKRENRCLTETGILDLTDHGHGFITHLVNSYRLYPESTYVPAALVRRHGLRRGQSITLLAQPPQNGERCPSAVRILQVMGGQPDDARNVTAFEELTPYYPTARILVEAPAIHKDISMRAVDLLTPIGFGQRGLIVAPPRTGKTVLLQNIANSISHNFPAATLLLLLIDERPEEVTDFRRHTRGEVVASTFDEGPESHVHAAEMVIERARRLVENGHHVIILLDSITRLARAYNALAGNGGKTMSGGIESNALQRPKRFFGSARNIEGGGSLTILATALIDTNSRMDEVIFEEFKGTGNMELHLDRGLSDKRIFPAINIDRSGTRKEELIYHPDEMLRVYGLRRAMQGIPPVEAMDMFIQRLKKTRTNAEFLLSLNR